MAAEMQEVVIHGIAVNGEGVGRLADGRVVFVERALVGDRVRVQLKETRKRVQYADLLQVLVPSDDRVSSRCAVERCGGCPLRWASTGLQHNLKRQTVVETMRRIGGIAVDGILGSVRAAGSTWGYRHRVRLHAQRLDGAWRLGYFERRSKRLVPLMSCPVIWPELERLGRSLDEALAGLPEDIGLASVELAYSRRDGRGAAKLNVLGSVDPLRRASDWFDASGLSGVHVAGPTGSWRWGNLELRYDHGRADAFDLRFEPGLFTQAYPEANDMLVEAVLAAVRPTSGPTVLELHAGIGNFSVPLVRAGARVEAFESQRRAAILCQRNGRAPGMHLDVQAAPDTAAESQLAAAEVVVLDPPRTGARPIIELAAQRCQGRIVYVSCDVATLARDAAILGAGGYRLVSLEAFDLFPQTPHVESLGVFERAA